MQRYLCVETTGQKGFIALFCDSKKEIELPLNQKRFSDQLIVQLQTLLSYLKKGNLKMNFIAVSAGPGRFTGLRAGVNFSKTLAYYFKIPIYSCSTLRLIAEPYLKDQPVLCLMEAFGQMFYAGGYKKKADKIKVLIPPQALTLKDLQEKITQPFLCAGDVYEDKQNLFPKKIKNYLQLIKNSKTISSKSFSQVVLSELKMKALQSWEKVEPIYLRTQGLIKT